MKKMLKTALLTISLLAFASATLPALALELTLYPQGDALVQEERALSLKPGSTTLSASIPRAAYDAVLLPDGLNWPSGVQFWGMSHALEAAPEASNWIGQPVLVKDIEEDDDAYTRGILKAVNAARQTAYVLVTPEEEDGEEETEASETEKNGAEASETALWEVPLAHVVRREVKAPVSGAEMQTLEFQFYTPRAKTVTGLLAYQHAGLRADVHYLWMLPEHLGQNPTKVGMQSLVELRNESDQAFEAARLNAIFGRLNRSAGGRESTYAKRQMVYAMAAEAMPVMGAGMPEGRELGEQILVTLPGKYTLKAKQQKTVAWQNSTPQARLAYVYAPTQNNWWWRNESGRFESPNTPVQHWLEVDAVEKRLPAGRATVFQQSGKGAPKLMAETTQAAHIQAGEPLRLLLGEAEAVQARKAQVSYHRQDKTTRVGYEVTLLNNKEKAVAVQVHEYPQRNWQLVESSVPAGKVAGVPLAFEVAIPAKGQSTLRYTFTFQD